LVGSRFYQDPMTTIACRAVARLTLAATVLGGPRCLAAQAAATAGPSPSVVLLTDRALDGHGGQLRGRRIGVAGGKITSLSTPARGPTIDLRGYTVMPGWIDTHGHLDSHWDRTGRIATETEPPMERALGIAQAAWATLMGGFTTVQTVGDPTERPLRDAIRDRGFPGPRVLTSLAWVVADTATSDDSLRALVRARQAEGADLIKIFSSNSQRVGATPTLTERQLAILCAEVRALGLRSMVHAYRGQVGAAARAGCNQVEHATYAERGDIEAAAKAGTFISPQVGLVVQNYLEHKARYLGVGNYTEEGMAIMQRDLPLDFAICRLALTTPGAKVVFSTDATAGAHGRNAEEFIGRVRDCGQSPMAALTSAQGLAAEALGMSQSVGRLAPGYEADIIALDGDPLQDITAVRRVVFVMRGGQVVKWAGARAR
jgi:imidazolonepropionase-like amidohydrolase